MREGSREGESQRRGPGCPSPAATPAPSPETFCVGQAGGEPWEAVPVDSWHVFWNTGKDGHTPTGAKSQWQREPDNAESQRSLTKPWGGLLLALAQHSLCVKWYLQDVGLVVVVAQHSVQTPVTQVQLCRDGGKQRYLFIDIL